MAKILLIGEILFVVDYSVVCYSLPGGKGINSI